MPQEVPDNLPHSDLMQITTQVVAAYVGHNSVGEAQIPEVIKSVYASLAALNGHTEAVAKAKQKPAVPIKRSITDEYLICLEDGKKLKMLKRHLRTAYDLSPEDYRARWGLGSDYPMVAPDYAKQRSALAKKIGLGKLRS
jgi:predicted transcriptional regulator